MDTNITQNNFIGKRIAKSREQLNITRFELADIMHLSKSMVGKWERGISNPSTAHLIKLAEVLKVSFNWLATGVEEKTLINGINKGINNDINENTIMLKITQLLNKTNARQKQYLCDLLVDIVK